MSIFYLVILGLGIVFVTRFVLCDGIERLSSACGLSAKTKGQILGYSTSLPELVGTLSTAWLGLLGAGLWNVAASNIINLVLFLSANLYFKQQKALTKKQFLDEAGFAVGAILIPIVLVFGGGWERSPWTASCLFAFFVVYLVVDWKLNRKVDGSYAGQGDVEGSHDCTGDEKTGPGESCSRFAVLPVIMIAVGLAMVVVMGHYLGGAAENVVKKMGVPQAGVGWIMGVATSLPELTSFFAIYGAAKKKGRLGSYKDTQEALDNLAASNMSNLGLVYPIGILIFIAAGH